MTTRSEKYDVAGADTFIVPADVYEITVTLLGGGGGGGGSYLLAVNRSGGGGGGGGEYLLKQMIAVTPGEVVAVNVGAGGLGITGASGGDGGATSITAASASYQVGGGFGGSEMFGPGGSPWGAGGGYTGALGPANSAAGIPGTRAGMRLWGGSSGSGLTSNAQTPTPPDINGNAKGGDCGSQSGGIMGIRFLHAGVFFNAGGGGGAASIYGNGVNGGDGEMDGNDAVAPGSGGSGAGGCNGMAPGTTLKGGNGAPGLVLIEWVEP